MASSNKLTKDGSSSLAGPIHGFDLLRSAGRGINYQTIKLDCSQYLVQKRAYKFPSTPGCCLDLSGWEALEFKRLRKMILKMAEKNPGAFVWDEPDDLKFPKTTPEQVEFFVAAGFVTRDAERLAFGDARVD